MINVSGHPVESRDMCSTAIFHISFPAAATTYALLGWSVRRMTDDASRENRLPCLPRQHRGGTGTAGLVMHADG